MSGPLTLARDGLARVIEALDAVEVRRDPDLVKLWADHFRQDLASLSLLAQREDA